MTIPGGPDYECLLQMLTFNGRTASEALWKLAAYCEQRELAGAVLPIEGSHIEIQYEAEVASDIAWTVTIAGKVVHRTLADFTFNDLPADVERTGQ